MSRRTIRKYAHELYPYPADLDDDGRRDIAADVRYWVARAIGLDVYDTSWIYHKNSPAEQERDAFRMELFCATARLALLADALAEARDIDGPTPHHTWDRQAGIDEYGEFLYDISIKRGIDIEKIKPYPCGPEPEEHKHYIDDPYFPPGVKRIVIIHTRESECPDCTEEVTA